MNSFLQAFKEFSDSIKTVVLKDRKAASMNYNKTL